MTEYNVEISERQRKAKELYFELLENGFVQANEEGATTLLTASARRAEYDVKERPQQKKLYKGKAFGFESAYALAVYFITECPVEWEKWKRQCAIWESIEETVVGQQAKDDARPTIDRIDDSKGYVRDNLQTLSDRENREKAYARMRKGNAILTSDGNILGLEFSESYKATENKLGVSYNKVKNMGKRGYAVIDEATGKDTGATTIVLPMKTLPVTATEEEYKAQCKAYGITYETAEVRAEREKRMLASISAKQPQ